MAILARCRVWEAGLLRESVDARTVTVALTLVTTPATDWLCDHHVVGVFRREISMAACAGVRFVHGSRNPRWIDEQRHPLPHRIRHLQRLVRMAIEARAVFDRL